VSFKSKIILVASVGLVMISADQVSKIWARGALVGPTEYRLPQSQWAGRKISIPVIGDRPGVEFRLSYNTGSAFGLFSDTPGARVFLSIIGLLALGLIFYLLKRPESNSKLFVWALACVAGGAIGNLIDRIAFGKVTDFVVVWLTQSVSWLWPWPAFNIADVALVVGVGLMLITIFFVKLPETEGQAKKGAKGTAKGRKGSKAKTKAKPKTEAEAKVETAEASSGGKKNL
jgi:signal peptidase II